MTAPELRHSPLHAEHLALGAKMVEFGGWEMPIQYTSVIDEHLACRRDAVMFDVSHLGTVEVAGAGAYELLQTALTNDLARISPGRAQYTHLLDPVDGHVVDDIIVWWQSEQSFSVMPNASNTSELLEALQLPPAAAGLPVECADVTSARAVIAVQGPKARVLLGSVSADAAAVPRFGVSQLDWGSTPITVAGTGYTGEDGVEIAVPRAAAPTLWRELLAAGVTPAGLGARDTLRLEAGLPLHGHELGAGITPLQAGLAWVVRFDKGDFRGRAALLRERERGLTRHLVGFSVAGRQPPRAGCAVLAGGVAVGEVTSGNYSPVLGHGIALGFVTLDVVVGDSVEIDVRGRRLAARVVTTPFVKNS